MNERIDTLIPDTWSTNKLKRQYKVWLQLLGKRNEYRGIDIELRLALYRVLIGMQIYKKER